MHPQVSDGEYMKALKSDKNTPLFKIILIRHGEKTPRLYIYNESQSDNLPTEVNLTARNILIDEVKNKYNLTNLTENGKRYNFLLGMEMYHRLSKEYLANSFHDIEF